MDPVRVTYMAVPCMAFVVDDGGSEAAGRVDASSGDGYGRQMNEENSKPDGERSQNLQHTYLNFIINNDVAFSLSSFPLARCD